MSKFISTFILTVLLLAGTRAQAQVLLASDFNVQAPSGVCDSTLQQNWNGSTWQTDSIQKATFNNGYLSSLQWYDPASGKLSGGFYFTRNTSNKATKLEVKADPFGLGMVVFAEYTATYDVNGNVTEQIGKQLNFQTFQLDNYEKLNITYDQNGNVTEILHYEWDGSQWADLYMYTYSYNTSNQRTGYVTKYYDQGNWLDESRVTYTYTASGEVETETTETWSGSTWDNFSRQTHAYDASNERIATVSETWASSSWENDMLDSVFSDGTGITYTWNNTAWVPSERIVCGTPSMSNPPSDPHTLSATSVSSSQIDLSWAHTDNTEEGFVIQRSPDGTTWATIDSTGIDIQSFSDMGLIDNTTYYYRVAAYNADGLSGWSNTANATTMAIITIPVAPTDLSAVLSGNKALLDWTDNASDEDGFVIYRSQDNITFDAVDSTGTDENSYEDPAIISGKYYYYVTAYNSAGESSGSDTAMIDIPTGIREIGNEIDITLYPNPASKLLSVRLTNAGQGQVKLSIKDLNGKTVLANELSLKDGNLQNIDISRLAAGAYLLEINAANTIYSNRLIVK